MRTGLPVAAAVCIALVPAAAQHASPEVDALAQVQALNATVLASRSATAVLEQWCQAHRLAGDPRITARVVESGAGEVAPEQRRRLRVSDRDEVKHRRVELRCGSRILSTADNWYVPARLTAAMNRILDTTDTPFGRVVAALEPTRETFSARMLWVDSAAPVPDALFEHHAVLYTGDHQPFAEVAERYRKDLLASPSVDAPMAERTIRDARASQNEAIAAGNLDRAAAFWTDDVTVRRALGQPLSGREEARRALQPATAPAPRIVYQRLTTSVDVSAQWPLAFETGSWEGHLETPGGPTIVAGRYSAQWVRRADRWLIRSEVFVALTCSGVGCQSAAVP